MQDLKRKTILINRGGLERKREREREKNVVMRGKGEKKRKLNTHFIIAHQSYEFAGSALSGRIYSSYIAMRVYICMYAILLLLYLYLMMCRVPNRSLHQEVVAMDGETICCCRRRFLFPFFLFFFCGRIYLWLRNS